VATIAERRRLIINADDFGFTNAVNRGIVEAFAAGALRSASIMVGMPGFHDAARAARAAGDTFGIGLHLTLTNGRPLSHCPSLIDRATGEFVSLRRLAARIVGRRIRPSEVAGECAAQIARCRATGLRISHLDGHQHVHALPIITDIVRAMAHQEGIRFWRRPAESIMRRPRRLHRLPQRLTLSLLARSMDAGGPQDEPRTTDHFAGGALLGAVNGEQVLLELLDALPVGTTELMVHPGYVDDSLPGGDRYSKGRERELNSLTSPAVLARLGRGDIELTHFGRI
jgi:chitin disaccharide deacetylase